MPRRAPPSSSPGCRRRARRSPWPTRRGPPASASRGPARRRRSPASWRLRAASPGRPASASRPTAATPSGWPACCASRSSSRCACRALPRRRPATWCAPFEDARGDLMRARQRLAKLLLRRGIVWEERASTQAHELWLVRQRFSERPLQIAYEEAMAAMLSVRDRRDALDAAIAVEEAMEPWAETVARLACLRGVSTLTAFALTVEIGDWQRFSGRSLAAFLGLTPSESSSGASRRQGAITKTGNAHVRRLLVEAAWQQRRRPGKSLRTHLARAAQPAAVRERAVAAERRLRHRWVRFDERGKRSTVAAVAVARELAGWCSEPRGDGRLRGTAERRRGERVGRVRGASASLL